MPNIQIIDGADNCTYDVFEISADGFREIFPREGQDIEFVDEFVSRVGERHAGNILNDLWKHRANKKNIEGIHGTLFFELEKKKAFYPTKKESEMSLGI